MIINKLELTNFRKHRKLEVDLKTGVTGIIGDNGTGKSSIVEALQFALTGELYHGKKTDAITVGEDSGSVRMNFTLNGKKGTLTRYMSAGNLQLSYGSGGVKKKAGDVKELWDSLLQVGPEIISKVIIAKQGDIPLLFSGSSSIREKIFQKIFLVPNTEKIRNSIQTNYMKQLPPLLYSEDLEDLKQMAETCRTKLTKLNQDIAQLNLLPEGEIENYRDRIKFINKCQSDAGMIIILREAVTKLQDNIGVWENEVNELSQILSTIKLEDYELQRNTQLQQKALFAQKLKLEIELERLNKITISQNEYLEKKAIQDANVITGDTCKEKMIRAQVNLTSTRERLARYENISGQSVCDTCGQALHSVIALVEELKKEEEEAKAIYLDAKKRWELMEGVHTNYRNTLSIEEGNINERNRVTKSLEQFKDLTFDEGTLNMFTEVIAQYREYERDLRSAKESLNEDKRSLLMQQQELNNLSIYDRDGDPAVEKEQTAFLLQKHDEATRQHQILQVEARMKEMELKSFADREKASKENAEKNQKRNRYSELLGIALDTLSTRQFPRKLILNYADVVSEYLQEKLQGFNIPYTAKVGEDFEIEMFNDLGRKLPSVSGGQEIQVGISLHLALHELFSQSFPLLVIDEGTTHLDTTNRKAYFEIIKKLKANDKLQQIIIIDHDPQLREVVDNVVELESND